MLSYVKAAAGIRRDDARPSSFSSGSSVDSSPGDLHKNKGAPYIVMAPVPPKKVKHQSPQDAIDEFWEKFSSKSPGRGKLLPTASAGHTSQHLVLHSIHDPSQEQNRDQGRQIGSKGRCQRRKRRCFV
jgi:hypothetical protein